VSVPSTPTDPVSPSGRNDASADPTEAGVAQDASTLTEVLAELERDGFAGQTRVVAGARLECLTCREVFDAQQSGDVRQRRLEGASDPADMLIVVGLSCPRCGIRATAILNYGPDSTVEDVDVLSALER
jgi:hypothetical protein